MPGLVQYFVHEQSTSQLCLPIQREESRYLRTRILLWISFRKHENIDFVWNTFSRLLGHQEPLQRNNWFTHKGLDWLSYAGTANYCSSQVWVVGISCNSSNSYETDIAKIFMHVQFCLLQTNRCKSIKSIILFDIQPFSLESWVESTPTTTTTNISEQNPKEEHGVRSWSCGIHK